MKIKILPFYLSLLLLFFFTNTFAQVPYEWPIINSELNPKLNSINQKIDSLWNLQGNQPYCTLFGGGLDIADASRGYSLFSPLTPPGPLDTAYENQKLGQIDTALIMLDSLGFKFVEISIGYPVLVDSFPNSQLYLAFYKKVYAMAHSLGFKIIDRCSSVFTSTNQYLANDVKNFYYIPNGVPDTLNTLRYEQTMTQMRQTIIDSLTPDYLSLEVEPSTQTTNLQNLISFAPDSTLSQVNYYLSHLTHKGNILYGAGAQTYDSLSYFTNYAQTAIDYIDYHLFIVNDNLFDNRTFQIDSIAKAYGKRIVVGECSLHLNSDSEVVAHSGDPAAGVNSISSAERDVFDYFEDLDTLFEQTMINLSQQANIDMILFVNTLPQFGYLTWQNSYESMSTSQITNTGNNMEFANMFNLQLGPFGKFTQEAISKVNCNPTGVNNIQISTDEINVYPNPAKDYLTIETNLNTEQRLDIINLMGQTIYTSYINKKATINTSAFPRGVYILKLYTEKETVVKKFVKE